MGRIMNNMRVLIVFAIAFLAATGAAAQTESGRNVVIGVVIEGQNAGADEFMRELREDLTSLLGSKYELQIYADKALDADWSAETATRHYTRLVQDADVDIIVVLGVLAVDAIARNQDYAKPVVMLGVTDPERLGLPPVTDNTSGVRNLNYVMINRSVDRDLDAFHEVFQYNRVGIVLYDELVRFMSADPDIFRDVMDKNQTSFELVPMGAAIENVLSSVSEEVDALYLGYLGPFEGETKGQLIDAINARGLPSFAWSAAEVERGVLASIAPDADRAKIVRRISLNVEAILNGEDPADLPVNLSFEENLQINMQTANKIGFAPTFAVLAKAELVDEFAMEGARTLRLVDVMREAMQTNLGLKIEEQIVESAKKDVSLATSDYLPSLSLDASGVQVDKDRAENSGGQQPGRLVSGGAALEQTIFSEQMLGNISTQKHLLRASQYDYDGLRLDVVLEAGTAYLNILGAQARRKILQDQLDLTRRNLGIAKQRAAVGYSGQSDVYRWESRFYTANTELLAAKNDVELAKMQLNVVLNRPVEEAFVAEEAGFEESGYTELRDGVQGYIDSPRSLRMYAGFLVEEAMRNSPEVQALDASIEALSRSYTSLKRKPWIPTLGLRAEYQHVFGRYGAGSRVLGIETNDNLWSVSVAAQLPLFLGGSTRVSARKARIEITVLEEQRKQLVQAIEFNVRSAMLEVLVARVNRENAQRSAELSRESLELVQDEYAKGLSSIVDLVDAQNEALSDNLNALSSEYEFLINVFNTDRAVGRFELLRTPEERQEFLSRFEAYLGEHNR